MRVVDFEIDGFGRYAGERIDALPPGLVVLHGPNESGKSTLLAFLRAVLFGFPRKGGREKVYEPLAGGRHGGRVRLETARGAVVVERHKGRAGVALHFEDGSTGGADELGALVSHIDDAVFKNVFAFGLDELQNLSSLEEGAVQARIFSAGITGAGRSARDAMTGLDKRARELLAKRGGGGQIQQLLARRAELQEELGQRRSAARDYPRLAAEEERLARALDVLRAEIDAAHAGERRARKLVETWREVYAPLEDRREALAKLEQNERLGSVESFPDDAERSLNLLVERIERAQSDARECEAQLERLERGLEKLPTEPRLLALGDSLEALFEQEQGAGGIAEQRARRDDAERVRSASETRAIATLRDELGEGWDRERVLAIDRSLARVREAEGWAQRLAVAEDSRTAARRAAAEAERAADELAQRSAAVAERRAQLAAPDADVLETSVRALRDERGRAARAQSLAERERESRKRAEALRDDVQQLPSAAWARACASVGLVAAAFAAAPFALRSFVARFGNEAPPPWLARLEWVDAERWQSGVEALSDALPSAAWSEPALSLAAAASIASFGAMGIAWWLRRQASARRLRSLDRIASCEAEAGALRGQREALGEILSERELDERTDSLDRARAKRAADELLAQQLAELERDAADLRRKRAAAEAAVRETERTLEQLAAEWAQWLAARGLPADSAAARLPAVFDALRRAGEAFEDAAEHGERGAALAANVHAWEQAASHLLGQLDVTAESPSAGLAEQRRRLDRARAHAATRERREEECAVLRARRESLQAALDRHEAELAALYRAGGAADEVEFRRRLSAVTQRAELRRAIETLQNQLEGRIGRGPEAKALRDELAGGALSEWEDLAERSQQQVAALIERNEDEVRAHHEASARLADLEQSAAVAGLELQREALESELAEAVREWQRVKLAAGLVQSTLERFERERQPGVLRDASSLFELVTNGRYARIVQSSEEQGDGFAVLGSDQRRKAPSQLSRGTAEQLYLCIRLGLMAEFARSSGRLPVVMDDVLVNFDDERAAAMARALARFAQDSTDQLLFFTCNGRTRELLAPHAALVRGIGDGSA